LRFSISHDNSDPATFCHLHVYPKIIRPGKFWTEIPSQLPGLWRINQSTRFFIQHDDAVDILSLEHCFNPPQAALVVTVGASSEDSWGTQWSTLLYINVTINQQEAREECCNVIAPETTNLFLAEFWLRRMGRPIGWRLFVLCTLHPHMCGIDRELEIINSWIPPFYKDKTLLKIS
jgi:hypothetical protein